MQFNYQEALNVVREKRISWAEYFYRSYGLDISSAINSYQDHLAVVVNNVDDNVMKLEDYITRIARGIEGASESLENTLTDESIQSMSRLIVNVEHLNVEHDDNTETCVFDETEVLTVFTKTGIVCKGVMYLEPGDILVGRKYVSKVKQIHK
jgi:hypothetical protein